MKTMIHEVPHQRKQPINREGQVDKNYLSATAEKPKKVETLPKIIDETRGMTKGVVRSESNVTVLWKVPHEKQADDPRIDLDYAQSWVHPPSIN